MIGVGDDPALDDARRVARRADTCSHAMPGIQAEAVQRVGRVLDVGSQSGEVTETSPAGSNVRQNVGRRWQNAKNWSLQGPEKWAP